MLLLTAGLVAFTVHAFAVCVSAAVLHHIFVYPFAGVISGHVTVHVVALFLIVHVGVLLLHPFPFLSNVTVTVLSVIA